MSRFPMKFNAHSNFTVPLASLLSITTLVGMTGCATLSNFLEEPDTPQEQPVSKLNSNNPVELKLYERNEQNRTVPQAHFQAFLDAQAHENILGSPLGINLFDGKSDAGTLEVVQALLEPDPSTTGFWYDQLWHPPGARTIHGQAYIALGVLRHKDFLALYTPLLEGKNEDLYRPTLYTPLIEAIWYNNDRDHGEITIAKLLTGIGQLTRRPNNDELFDEMFGQGLAVLEAWSSDSAVETCSRILKDPGIDTQRWMCAQHLGARRAHGAAKDMILFDKYWHSGSVSRAIAQLDSVEGAHYLEGELTTLTEADLERPGILAGLLRQGRDQHWPAFEKTLLGQMSGSDRPRADLAQAAAFESIQLKSPKFNAKIEQALKKALTLKYSTAEPAPTLAIHLALALRGDSASLTPIIEALSDADSKTRQKALSLVGGNFFAYGSGYAVRGPGIVVDERLQDAVRKYYALETSAENKGRAVALLASLRSAIELRSSP